MDGAPYPTVDPRDLVVGTGAYFDDGNSHARATAQPRIDPWPQAPAIPYNVPPPPPPPPSPPRTTYGPLAYQGRLTPNSPRRHASNPKSNPNHIVPPFPPRSTPPPPSPPPSNTRIHAQQNVGLGLSQMWHAPPAPQALPRVEVSPADPIAMVEKLVAATTPAAREQWRSRGGILSTPSTAGVQRRRSSSAARRPAPYALPAASPTVMQGVFPPPAMNNVQAVGHWLPGPYNVGDHNLGEVMQPPSLGSSTAPASNPPLQSRPSQTSRSPSRSIASNNGPFYCTDPACKTPNKAYGTRSELTKHARIHRPKSERTHGCAAQGCKKRFWELKDLRRHEETHNGEKVQCEVCHDWLSREDNLKRHMEVVHSDRVAPTTPSVMTVSSPSMLTASSPALSFADSFAPSDGYSPTIPSSPPSLGGPSFPPSGSRIGMPRHSSFNSAQGSPLQYKYNPDYSEAMEKSQSNGL